MNLAAHIKGPIGQKAGKPENGTRRGLLHMRRVKQLPCVICGMPGPSDAHHVISGRYGSAKASDFETVPLCKNHHQGPDGIHTAKTTWEFAYGPDTDYLSVTADMLAGEYNSPWEAK